MTSTIESLYEQDFNLWIEEQVKALRERNFKVLDWDNLLEEIETLGKSDRRELRNRTIILVMHLLKWKYQSNKQTNSWRNTIRIQRREINNLLQESPSLRGYLEACFTDWYSDAREDAANETQLPLNLFSNECPFSLTEILKKDWLPK